MASINACSLPVFLWPTNRFAIQCGFSNGVKVAMVVIILVVIFAVVSYYLLRPSSLSSRPDRLSNYAIVVFLVSMFILLIVPLVFVYHSSKRWKFMNTAVETYTSGGYNRAQAVEAIQQLYTANRRDMAISNSRVSNQVIIKK